MQSCNVCGWNTSPGTATCAACRREQLATGTREEKARLISTVLAQARATPPAADASDSVDPAPDPDGEHVLLREMGIADEPPAPVRQTDRPPTEIAASLRKLLDTSAPPADDVDAPAAPEPVVEPAAPPAQPTVEIVAYTVNAPLPTPREEPAEEPRPPVAAVFRDVGGWTAVAKVALLCAGVLSVLQVLVLLIVYGALTAAAGGDSADAARVIAAYTKVSRVMLPTLLAVTAVVAAFAMWRSVVDRSARNDAASPTRRVVAGLPLPLWAVLAAACMLVAVLIGVDAADVAGAQRATQWLIVVCVLLAVACFLGPRGLETAGWPTPDVPHSGSTPDVPPTAAPAGSRSAA